MNEKRNLNTGKLWTEVDDRVLMTELEAGRSIEEAARVLGRTTEEVEKRMRDMGLSVAS